MFEELHDAERVRIVIESAVIAHGLIEGDFASVSERGVAEVVGQGDRLREILVDPEGAGEATRQVCDLQRVRQACTKVIAERRSEHLRLVFKATKSSARKDAVTVQLERRP